MKLKQNLNSLKHLRDTFKEKKINTNQLLKLDVHLQDATPIKLGQEISGWRYMLDKCEELLAESKTYLKFGYRWNCVVQVLMHIQNLVVAKFISENTGYNFVSSENKFHALTSHDEVVQLHGTLKAVASRLNENRQ